MELIEISADVKYLWLIPRAIRGERIRSPLVARRNLTAAFNKVSRCAVIHAEAFTFVCMDLLAADEFRSYPDFIFASPFRDRRAIVALIVGPQLTSRGF